MIWYKVENWQVIFLKNILNKYKQILYHEQDQRLTKTTSL